MNRNGESYPGTEYPADTLGMPVEDMKRLGYQVVDAVIARLASRHEEPAILTGSPDALWSELGGSLPEESGDVEAALAQLINVALAHQQHGDHPRYFARVPGPACFAAIAGEWLSTGFNTIAASWAGGSGPATVELVVIEWLRQLMGLPENTEGILVSGGSIANLTALATGRACVGRGVVYMTDQTHSSLARALHELGYEQDDIKILPSDDQFRMSVERLAAAIEEDRRLGRKPTIVAATAGTTNTGAVDPLPFIAGLCQDHGMWFHVDGAYGAPAALCESGRAVLGGLELADSLVLDPHKWLFQPYDVGCTLVSRPGALEKTFSMNPEYLKDVQGGRHEVDFRSRSLETTRRSRAIKIWLSLRTYGAERMRHAVARGIELGKIAQTILEEKPLQWEVVTPAQLGIVTFALRNMAESEHAVRANALSNNGFACVSSTVLKNRSVLRLCVINPLTTEQDLRETIRRLGADPNGT